MNQQIRRAVTLGTALAVAGTLAACGSSAGGSTPAKSTEQTLRFVAQDEDGNMTVEDLGTKSAPNTVDLGDVIAFTQTLTLDGKPAGEAHVVSVGVDHKRHLSESTGTMTLHDGSIQLAGIVSSEPTFTLTVVGGTGKYAGATGAMDFDGSGDTQRMTVHLLRPAG